MHDSLFRVFFVLKSIQASIKPLLPLLSIIFKIEQAGEWHIRNCIFLHKNDNTTAYSKRQFLAIKVISILFPAHINTSSHHLTNRHGDVRSLIDMSPTTLLQYTNTSYPRKIKTVQLAAL